MIFYVCTATFEVGINLHGGMIWKKYFSHYYNDELVCRQDVTAYKDKQVDLLKENIWLHGSATNPNNGIINKTTSKEEIEKAQNDYVNSPKHYANIIELDTTKIGIG